MASALPRAAFKRQVSELRDSYDFVIAGGGTTGLTVADRLTEAFFRITVLVVEYGEIEYAPGVFDPPQAVWGGTGSGPPTWAFNTLPNPEVDNKTGFVLAGHVVGGSSAVNGMFFDRPSRSDFEAWDQASRAGHISSEDRWDWDGIFPYFQKGVTFTEPDTESVAFRGIVRLDLASPLEQPILDYRSGSNPVDMNVHVAHVRYLRDMLNTPSMQMYGAVEMTPGADVNEDEGLIQAIKDGFTFSYMHPCCTAAQLPEEKGGVVGPDLKVYGAAGLRVVDMSILPLVTSSHLSALAYAVAEKAVDIIIREWT